jgi:hypothetical protein
LVDVDAQATPSLTLYSFNHRRNLPFDPKSF